VHTQTCDLFNYLYYQSVETLDRWVPNPEVACSSEDWGTSFDSLIQDKSWG
jgi:hypothetical protein